MSSEKNYVKGIIGGILGGLIATIPWILVYVYGNLIVQLLSVVIAVGVLKGYQMFHGKIDNKLPIIVVVISVLSITIATFLIIPILLMAKENMNVSLANLQRLFQYDVFISALFKDYAISLLFTFLGVGGVVSNIKKQLNEGITDDIKIDLSNINNNVINNNNQENIELFREAFLKYEATSKEKAIEKDKILEEINMPNAKSIFSNLRTQQIIAKYQGKYYFKEKYADSILKRFLKLFFIIFGSIILFTILIILLVI